MAVIDLKRKKLEKKASARRLNLDLASAPGSASDTINAQTDGAAATAPIFDASAHSPSQSLPIEAIETDTTSDDDIPTWASSQKSDKGNVLSALGSDYNGLEGSGKKSPEDGNLSPRGHDDDNGDSRYGHSPSLSRTISMGDGGRESATESPIPALFMAGVGGEAVEFDASADLSRLWITGKDWHKHSLASPAPAGNPKDKSIGSLKSRRPAPPPPNGAGTRLNHKIPINTHGFTNQSPSGTSRGSSSSIEKKTKFSNHTGSGYEAI